MEDDANTWGDPQGKGFWVRGCILDHLLGAIHMK